MRAIALSLVFRGGAVRFFVFLAAFAVRSLFWFLFFGFSLLVINSYLSKKKKEREEKKRKEEKIRRKGRKRGKRKRKRKECCAVSRPGRQRTRNCATRGRFPPTLVILRLGAM